MEIISIFCPNKLISMNVNIPFKYFFNQFYRLWVEKTVNKSGSVFYFLRRKAFFYSIHNITMCILRVWEMGNLNLVPLFYLALYIQKCPKAKLWPIHSEGRLRSWGSYVWVLSALILLFFTWSAVTWVCPPYHHPCFPLSTARPSPQWLLAEPLQEWVLFSHGFFSSPSEFYEWRYSPVLPFLLCLEKWSFWLIRYTNWYWANREQQHFNVWIFQISLIKGKMRF